MKRNERYTYLLDYFLENYPAPETELVYHDPYSLLVAVVLSAQCTDKRVNMVTPALLERFPTAGALGAVEAEEIFPYIRSISYPNNKAKHLAGLGKRITEVYAGKIPDTVVELQTLPGVGRKTANVIASVIHNKPTFAVDTHVFRVSRRIGLAPMTATTPLAVEKQLMKYVPATLVPRAHHWLILHGRYVCLARKPLCSSCPLIEACAFAQKLIAKEMALPDAPKLAPKTKAKSLG
jgi:endonuclease-3